MRKGRATPAGGAAERLSAPRIPDHELIRRIGSGSYGEVWLARNVLGTPRAVKIISRKRFSDPRPFEREFTGMRRFEPISRTHPGFVGILQVGRNERGGYFYYVMEIADDVSSEQVIRSADYTARTLSSDLARRGRLPVAECIELGISLTSALEVLHNHGLIHRDIKPSNIVFIQGAPRLADIGLVTEIADATSFLGTQGYVSPEGPGSPGADLYSLGKVLYEASTGNDCRSFPELPTELEPPTAGDVFRRLNEILLRACENNPRARYQAAGEMRAELWRCSQRAKGPAPECGAAVLQPRVPAESLQSERKQLTVLFISILVNSKADLEDSQAVFQQCLDAIRPAIQRYGGTVGQILNDGLMALFGAPVAHEDHAQRAVHAALLARRAADACRDELKTRFQCDIEVRISGNSGLAITCGSNPNGHYSATGDTVNLASRLLNTVQPGQILITDETHKAARLSFFTRPLGEIAFPGIGRRVRLFEVTGAQPPQNRLEASAAGGLTGFVGRSRELALLNDRLGEVRRGRGQVVLLAGEPGVGKSRLLLEFRNALMGDDLVWLMGRGLSFGSQIAYLPIIELLKTLFQIDEADDEKTTSARLAQGLEALGEGLGTGLPFLRYLFSAGAPDAHVAELEAQQRRLMTFEVLRKIILRKAQHHPVVLIIEDLHWVDKTSEDFLVSLAETVTMAPVFLLMTYRPRYKNPFPELSYVTRLTVQQLSESESAQLTRNVLVGAELPDPVRRLVSEKAEGNPFFVEEMIKSLIETGALRLRDGACEATMTVGEIRVPETIQGVITSRIDRLEPSAKRALQLASVIGREFSVRLLETIAEMDEPLAESLKQLKTLELIYERSLFPEHTCIFKHALTQEVAYHSLLIQRRKELHSLVAAAIEELYDSRLSDFYGFLAYHYEKGEEWDRALDYLSRAAETSHRMGAYGEEASLLGRAMAIAQRLGKTALAAELRGRRGSAWVKLGLWAEAKPDLETALAELPPLQLERRAELLLDLAGACFWDLKVPEMGRYIEEGYAVARKTGRRDLIAASEAWLGAARQSAGKLTLAARLFERALDRGADYCSASHAMYPLNLYWRGRISEALTRSRDSVHMYRHLSDAFAATFGHPHLGLALAAQGHYREALEVFQEARQLGLKHEVWTFYARGIAMSAGFHLDVFDFEGHEALASEARERGRSADFPPSVVSAGIDLVFNHAFRGNLSKAGSLLGETVQSARTVGGWHAWLWDLRLTQARAEVELARGRWQEALRWAEESFSKNRRGGRIKYRIAALVARARARDGLGRKSEAIADARQAIRAARALGDPAVLFRACTALLNIQGSDRCLAEARATARRICHELPEGDLQQRFLSAEPVRQLGDLPIR